MPPFTEPADGARSVVASLCRLARPETDRDEGPGSGVELRAIGVPGIDEPEGELPSPSTSRTKLSRSYRLAESTILGAGELTRCGVPVLSSRQTVINGLRAVKKVKTYVRCCTHAFLPPHPFAFCPLRLQRLQPRPLQLYLLPSLVSGCRHAFSLELLY